MLAIEATLVAYLYETLGVEAFAEVPKDYPDRFVTVERTGGSSEIHGAIDRPVVAVQSWAGSAFEAEELARQVDEALLDAPGAVLNLMSCERNSLYRFPDPDSRRSRYQGLYELVTN